MSNNNDNNNNNKNNNNLFYQIPESVISHNICPFLSLKEIVESFSKVCTLFAICSENGSVVETLLINDTDIAPSGLVMYSIANAATREHIISGHLCKCWKLNKLVIKSIQSNKIRQLSFWINYIHSFCNLKYLKVKRMYLYDFMCCKPKNQPN